MAEDFPAAYLQVKVETSDSEYHPDVDELEDSDNDASLNLQYDGMQLSSPWRMQREREQVLKQMKQELEHSHKVISELSCQLEKSEKKTAELQERIHHQEELLMRTEADHATDKAIADAENATLRKLLEQERKQRIFSEQKFKKILQPRKYVQLVKQRAVFTPALNASLESSATVNGDGRWNGGRFQRNNNENTDDEVLILGVIERQGSTTGQMQERINNEQRSQSGNQRGAIAKSQYPNNGTKNCSVFSCTTCGLTFNAGWKLISHVRCHQSKNGFGSISNGENITVAKSAMQQREIKLARKSTTIKLPSSIMPGNRPRFAQSMTQKTHSNKKFTCILCQNRFAIVSQLKMHQKQAHGIVDDKFCIGCSDCGEIFPTRKQHVRHRKIVHGTLYSSGWNKRPQANQTTDVPPAAPGTSKSSSQIMSKLEHGIDTKNPRAGWFCLCGRNFITSVTLKAHIRHFVEERKHVCNICGDTFSGMLFLKLHKFQVHRQSCAVTKMIASATGNASLSPISTAIENSDSCQITNESIHQDQETITNADTIVDAISSQTEQHQLVGDDPKVPNAKYKCTCGREYVTRSAFNTHARSKNKGRIFRCSLCPNRFDLHGNLKNHVRKAHKAVYASGRYACGNCAQTFESSILLVRHRFYLCKYRTNRKEKECRQKK